MARGKGKIARIPTLGGKKDRFSNPASPLPSLPPPITWVKVVHAKERLSNSRRWTVNVSRMNETCWYKLVRTVEKCDLLVSLNFVKQNNFLSAEVTPCAILRLFLVFFFNILFLFVCLFLRYLQNSWYKSYSCRWTCPVWFLDSAYLIKRINFSSEHVTP